MTHIFDIEDAIKHGVDVAIMMQNLKFWIIKNHANKKNRFDDHTWTYNSAEAFAILFPYWSPKQIRTILRKMLDDKIIISGNYNKIKFDHTAWYAFSDESFLPNGQIDFPKWENGSSQMVTPIPYNKPDSKHNTEIPLTTLATLLKEKFGKQAGSGFSLVQKYLKATWRDGEAHYSRERLQKLIEGIPGGVSIGYLEKAVLNDQMKWRMELETGLDKKKATDEETE